MFGSKVLSESPLYRFSLHVSGTSFYFTLPVCCLCFFVPLLFLCQHQHSEYCGFSLVSARLVLDVVSMMPVL